MSLKSQDLRTAMEKRELQSRFDRLCSQVQTYQTILSDPRISASIKTPSFETSASGMTVLFAGWRVELHPDGTYSFSELHEPSQHLFRPVTQPPRKPR